MLIDGDINLSWVQVVMFRDSVSDSRLVAQLETEDILPVFILFFAIYELVSERLFWTPFNQHFCV